jgi:hypothetical protein
MAYMSQERKKEIAPVVKQVLAKYKLKGSLGVRHHSTLVLNITEGAIDFIKNYNEVNAGRMVYGEPIRPAEDSLSINPYHFDKAYSDTALQAITELHAAMMKGNHDRSDSMSDYFDVGWYIDINIGQWNKPYKVAA